MICRKLFEYWKQELESEPDMWALRDWKRGICWRNKTLREAANQPEWTRWEHLRLHPDDLRAIEDSHSLAIKTGKQTAVRWRMFCGNKYVPTVAVHRRIDCKGLCGKAIPCSILLGYFAFVQVRKPSRHLHAS